MQFVAHCNFIQCGRNTALDRIFNRDNCGVDLTGAHMVQCRDHRSGRKFCCPASFWNSLECGFGECAFWTKIRKRLHGCLLYLEVCRSEEHTSELQSRFDL